jgi:hypothetical protein
MTDLPQPTTVPVAQRLTPFALPVSGLLLSTIAAACCRSAAGISLGLFFGGVAFATLLVPPLVAAEESIRRRLLHAGLVALGVAVVWLTALGQRLTFAQWFACAAALAAYVFALAGVCAVLIAVRVLPVLAAAATTTAGLLWLSWPVWLSHALRGAHGDSLVAWLVPAHPLFAINAVLIHFDTWDRHPLAYGRLTVLNQDVFYALPGGVLGTTLWHALLGGIAVGVTYAIGRRRRGPAASARYAEA